MTDDEVLKWVTEEILEWRPVGLRRDMWMAADSHFYSRIYLLDWRGFGLAVAKIKERGWTVTLDTRAPARVDVYTLHGRFFEFVRDDGYTAATWRAFYYADYAHRQDSEADDLRKEGR